MRRLLIYIKGIKDTERKLCENDAKMRKKIQQEMEKCFNKLTEAN